MDLGEIRRTEQKKPVALVTGSAGFIGFHISLRLLKLGWRVIGIDAFTDYYDVKLKLSRNKLLEEYVDFKCVRGKIEDPGVILGLFETYSPDTVIHLAAQAGVRYSIENPRSYLQSNVVGTFEILEAAKQYAPKHMLFASTSSAYGANKTFPYTEDQKADSQMSFYAATKKATENFAHSYAHLYNLPITMFRFFTVYGPWGRPDMALFKFVKAILADQAIDVYNNGEMQRDFTFIDDLVEAICRLIDCVPQVPKNLNEKNLTSHVAPMRVVNIGNSSTVELLDFIREIEKCLQKEAKLNFMPMQDGDVPATLASTKLLYELTGFKPSTNINVGIKNFIEWYLDYYKHLDSN